MSTLSPKTKNTTSFQDLNLFFQDVEILKKFNVYTNAEAIVSFDLKKPQCDSINRNVKNIFLRICKYSPSYKYQKDFLPKLICLTINGSIFSVHSKSKDSNWKTPLDITSKCKIKTTKNANKIKINLNSYKQFIAKGYGIQIVLAKKLTIGEQLQLLKTDLFIRKTEDTLKLIKENCSTFEDLECETIRVPLVCSVTKVVIQIPLVGKKCKHISCFEAQTFLQMMSNQPEWICTVCNNVIRKSDLVRDPFIEDILNNTRRSVDAIEFDKLGNFKVSKQENRITKKKAKVIECITLDGFGNDLGNDNLDNNNLDNQNLDNQNLNNLDNQNIDNHNIDNNNFHNITINSSIDVSFNDNFTASINTNLLIPKLETLPFFSHHNHLMNNPDFLNSIGLNSFTNNRTRKTATNNQNNNNDDVISLSDSSCIILDSDDDTVVPSSSNTIVTDSENTIITNNSLFNDESNSNLFNRGIKRNRNISSSSDSSSTSNLNKILNSINNCSNSDDNSNSENDSNNSNISENDSNNSNSENDSDNSNSENDSNNSSSENSSMNDSSSVSDSLSDSLSSLNSNNSITSNTSLSSGSSLIDNNNATPLLQSRNSLRLRHKKIRRLFD